MTKKKRYSPLQVLFELASLLRGAVIPVFFLFILKKDSTSTFIQYGRWIFLIIFGLTLWSIFYKWWTRQYEITEYAFTFYKGLFSKTVQTVKFTKIQNFNRHTSFFHRLFKLTSLHLETGMTGNMGTITFEVISQKEAIHMENHIKYYQTISDTKEELIEEEFSFNRTVHFKPTKKDILKASFTSLSFLLLIPLISSFYYKINQFFNIEQKTKELYNQVMETWWIVVIIIAFLLIISFVFSFVKTFIKYGKYEMSSDEANIYITKGVLDETAFSIAKERVQGIKIKQSFMKRILGVAEVKLLTAGGTINSGSSIETNTLYPFLPISQAYHMLNEILPSYEIARKMEKLPKKSFVICLLKPSRLWIIITVSLIYFKPILLKMDFLWIFIPIILLVIILSLRILNLIHTQYVLNEQFIQLKTGALTTSLFISKREKVIEVEMSQNLIQKKLQIASIAIVNRGKPVRYTRINDIPQKDALLFMEWYKERKHEVMMAEEY